MTKISGIATTSTAPADDDILEMETSGGTSEKITAKNAGLNPDGCVMTGSGTSVAGFTDVAISLDGTVFNGDGMYSGANPTRITAQRDGWYLINGWVKYPNTAVTGFLSGKMRLNGSTLMIDGVRDGSDGGSFNSIGLNTAYYLSSGDYVEFVGRHNHGSAITVSCQISMVRLGA